MKYKTPNSKTWTTPMPAPVHYHHGKFPPTALTWERLIPLVGPANRALAWFDGVLQAVPNALVLLSPLSTQEAVLSSLIEGTQTTVGEVLKYEAGDVPPDISPDKTSDIQEVINYRDALVDAVKNLEKLPLSLRLIQQAHAILMRDVRGENKTPGEFRRIQNYIGSPNTPIDRAKFVPIKPNELLNGMSRWEKFIHEPALDILVHLALVHVEFEALHPFLDGNGRLGRMLIPLFLHERKVLSRPVFYMSAWLEAHREEYCDRLRSVSRDNDWTGWCAFFLRGVEEQASDNFRKAQAIVDLYKRAIQRTAEITKSHKAIQILNFIFERPIFRSADFAHESGIPVPTAKRFLNILRQSKMLKTLRVGKGRQSSILAFPELLNIAEGRNVF
jgi:Fic family protein